MEIKLLLLYATKRFLGTAPIDKAIINTDIKATELVKLHFAIYLNSLSCLQSLNNVNIVHPYISYILYNYQKFW